MAEPDNQEPTSQATEPASSSVDVEALQKELSNVRAQRDGLLAKVKQAPTSAAQPTSSAASGDNEAANKIASLEGTIKSLTAFSSSLAAYQQTNEQKSALGKKATADGVALTDADIGMILGAKDQDEAYNYVKSLKESAPKHPNKPAPQSGDSKPQSQSSLNVGAQLFKNLNAGKQQDLSNFIPGARR